MSSTYVVAKLAAACVDENGVLYYLLSEQSYESNVYPRTPSWCARFFGRYEDCIARMIDGSSSIEGGSLKGEAKTSTAYIKQWRERLSAPVRLDKEIIKVRFSGGLYGLPVNAIDPVNALAREHGQPVSENGELAIDMNRDGALGFIAEILSGVIEGMYPWRLFRNPETRQVPTLGLGTPIPKAVSAKLDGVTVYQVKAKRGGDHDHFISVNGVVRSTGWEYSTMGSFISNEAVEAERLSPGAAEPMIHAFRKLVAAAVALPASTRIKVVKPKGNDDSSQYHSEKIGKFLEALGLPFADSTEFSFQDVINADITEDLRYLSSDFVIFQVAKPQSVEQAPEAQQQLLIA